MQNKMKELIAQIKAADTAYYKYDRPVLSDREYDALVDELKKLEAESGIILSGSPTQSVPGEILEELTPVRHTKPMLSADKTKSVDELIRFASGRAVLLSWKMDGLTLVLRYEGGKLKQAITRGAEGIVGEDVTHTARVYMNIPLEIPDKDTFEVRGEGVISWSNFDKINLDLEDPYTLPRNLAAGSTRKLDAGETKERFLEFFAFDLDSSHSHPDSKLAQLQFLEQNGFDVTPYVYLDPHCGPEQIREAVESFDLETFAYPVDGLIMEYEDITYGKSLGATGHHENRLIALKWQDELFETKFTGVELATTRTGMVSITGLFEPVDMGGSTVSRAYLHNLDIYENFRLGLGDTVKLYKANMIIPQLAENVTQSGTYRLATTCPCCGGALTERTTVSGTRQLFCENPGCAAKLIQKFVHFCEKTRMNIEGLSAKTLEKFIGHGWIRNFGDLYMLEDHLDEIIAAEGFGQKSYERLQASIDRSRCCALNQFIAGLGIPMVGRSAGRIISRHFNGDWDAFEQAIRDEFDFRALPDFGETMHNNIYQWYADEEEAKLWRPLLGKIEFVKENPVMNTAANNPFMGKAVVATGKLENYTRDGIQMKLLSLGARPASSVSKSTDYLIVGEKAGSKLEKARQLGVTVLTEQEFEDMLSQA
jgi:DNA ligase (NAD+)